MRQHFDALGHGPANYVPLTPLSFLHRAATLFGDKPAVIYGNTRRSWAGTERRIRRVAAALRDRGIGRGDTVSVLAPNIPEVLELFFAVPMVGAVLNTINTRLESETIAYILDHADSQLVIVDAELSPLLNAAFDRLGRKIAAVEIVDAETDAVPHLGGAVYDDLLSADPCAPEMPDDEWQAIALNYTSGTSGRPKGVVYHHRGAYLMALGTVAGWQMPPGATYLSVVPMFHCNGWCHPWAAAMLGAAMVFTRVPSAERLFAAISAHGVTHLGAAPVVLQMMAESPAAPAEPFDPPIRVMTAGAPPPPSILERTRALGMEVMHVYGLTETFGHITYCPWQDEWSALGDAGIAAKQARQGIAFPMVEDVAVISRDTGQPVPRDGETQGEIAIRGNVVMKGYYKNPEATAESFRGGWFWSGDAAIVDPDGYLQIRDRLKDVIISGGENISSVEVEAVLYRHPAIQAAAVVAKPDIQWGEVPCAFVELREGAAIDEAEVMRFCREHLAGFKTPKAVVFGPLPKTATGKIQKFQLRKQFADQAG